MVEAGIDQRQTQCVFPVDPSAYGIHSLSIGQALHELQHRRQSEPPWRFGVLATAGEQRRELVVGVDRTKFVGDLQTQRAFRERGTSHSIGRRRAMIVGYARTSTWDQTAGLAAQQRDLKAAKAEKVLSEQASSVAQRTKLTERLAFLREGDVLTVTKPDRLARSTAELLSIEADLAKRGIGLVVLSWAASGSTPATRPASSC